MIALLKGQVVDKTKHGFIVMTPGGVGYSVITSPLFLDTVNIGQEMTIHTYLKVSEQALDLYGFSNQSELDFFTLLMTVSGVGPKTALNILTLGPIDKIESAIGRGDVAYLTRVSGLGKKTAERLVVELKSKINGPGVSSQSSDVVVEVIEALVGMGYDRSVAKDVVTALDSTDKDTEKLLREALKKIR